MTALYFAPTVNRPPESPVAIPRSFYMESSRPQDYIADDDLVAAVNTALLLGQPLLLTGEPGTGKTQLAASVAYQLGYPPPLRYDCKSTSQARDILYTFDALGRFKAPSGRETSSAVDFIHYNALGKAILFANRPEDVAKLWPVGQSHPGPIRSVILVDEIDKAPRDFANDLLTELEEMSFYIPELHETVSALGLQPVVIITSNSERDLPDAFLRRCAYYDIPFPGRDTLKSILRARLGGDGASQDAFIGAALELFDRLRRADLAKRPATAELLGWMTALRRAYPAEENPLIDRSRARLTLGALVKNRDDLEKGRRILEAWIKP